MENRKTKLAKRLLRQALLELLEKKPLNKISVSELCKTADLNRSTFYAHYEDIFFLVHEMEQEFIDRVPYYHMLDNSYQAAYEEIKHLKENLKTFQILVDKGNLADAFVERCMETITKQDDSLYDDKLRSPTVLLALNYTVAGFIKSMEYWSYHQDEFSPEQLASILSDFGKAVSAISIK